MNAHDIIRRKRDGDELTAAEIEYLVRGLCLGEISDAQVAAWLMAVYFRGMSSRETADLTMSMVRSGQTLDLSRIPGTKVDKHSTGGVGDKTTLVLVPVLAAAGVPVVKMSGQSLGHTGGTLDKLASIPGFCTALTPEQMVSQVQRIGAAIAGQSAKLVPADKKIYSLRDMTCTVESIPLIAASVMSKKIAAGADAIVLDVKAGSGAFMKTLDDARTLAKAMAEVGSEVGRRTVAVVTDMNQPLGRAVGNSLEVREAIDTLAGQGPEDLVELCAVLGGVALVLAGKVSHRAEGERSVRDVLADGRGLRKFAEIIESQGGDPSVVRDTSLLGSAPIVRQVLSPMRGFVVRLDAYEIARAAGVLGAGRQGREAPDLAVGVFLHCKEGDHVGPGKVLAEVHARDEASATIASGIVLGAYTFDSHEPIPRNLVYDVLGDGGWDQGMRNG